MIRDSVYSITVTTYDNYHSLINVYVSGGTLVIDSKKSLRDENITVDIRMPELDYLNIGGSGDIYTGSSFPSSYVKANVSGSGKIDFAGNVSTMEAVISGSGNIYPMEQRSILTCISGSGNIRGFECRVNIVRRLSVAQGDIETNVSTSLDATISGSGNINYLGSPAVTVHISDQETSIIEINISSFHVSLLQDPVFSTV
ncbi:MAG: DUF2807 domain-containing protein [Saprospiraceae bacterium]|nr:DUF2807 domain-containing protein [Candidatus Brachybacter algidus]